jgi:hypothetical protein
MSVRTDNVNVNVIINGYEKGTTLKQMEGNLKQLRREVGGLAVNSQEWNDKMKQIGKLDADIKALKGNFKQAAEATSSWKEQITAAAAVVGAVLITKVVEFGKESVKAFMDAEKNAKQLEFALTQIGGAPGSAVDKLLEQSAVLQENGIFSDDDIQVEMTKLANLEVGIEDIQALMPLIADTAAQSGKSLAEVTDAVIMGMQGKEKALKKLGIEFDATGNKEKDLAVITEKMTKYQGAMANALNTSSGQAANLSNRWGEFQETVGGWINRDAKGFLDTWDWITGKITIADIAIRNMTQAWTAAFSDMTGKIIDQIDGQAISIEEKTYKTSQSISNMIAHLSKIHDEYRAGTITYEQYRAQTDALKASIQDLERYKASIKPSPPPIDEEALKRQIEQLQKLRTTLADIRHQMGLDDMTADEREVQRVKGKYDKLRKEAMGNAALLKEISELEAMELDKVYAAQTQRRTDAVNKQLEDAEKAAHQEWKTRKQVIQDIDTALMSAHEREIAEAQRKWDTLIAQAKQYNLDTIQLEAAKQADIDAINAAAMAKKAENEQSALNARVQYIDYEIQLWNSAKEAGAAIFDMLGEKSEQFAEFSKMFALFQIAVDTGLAISKSVAAAIANPATTIGGPIAKAAEIAGYAALILTNMARAKKVIMDGGDAPKYESGGYLNGPSHRQGGIDIVSNGQKIAEAEGDEAILSRATVNANRGLVDALIRSNGKVVNPFAYMPKGISFTSTRSALSSDRINQFAAPTASGSIPGAVSGSAGADSTAMLMHQNLQLMQQLKQVLSGGINARLSYDQHLRDQNAIDVAKRNGQIGG